MGCNTDSGKLIRKVSKAHRLVCKVVALSVRVALLSHCVFKSIPTGISEKKKASANGHPPLAQMDLRSISVLLAFSWITLHPTAGDRRQSDDGAIWRRQELRRRQQSKWVRRCKKCQCCRCKSVAEVKSIRVTRMISCVGTWNS